MQNHPGPGTRTDLLRDLRRLGDLSSARPAGAQSHPNVRIAHRALSASSPGPDWRGPLPMHEGSSLRRPASHAGTSRNWLPGWPGVRTGRGLRNGLYSACSMTCTCHPVGCVNWTTVPINPVRLCAPCRDAARRTDPCGHLLPSRHRPRRGPVPHRDRPGTLAPLNDSNETEDGFRILGAVQSTLRVFHDQHRGPRVRAIPARAPSMARVWARSPLIKHDHARGALR
jgi:hypothetical protein